MTVLELFAGAGGAALGLQAAGWTSVGRVELDPDACETLRRAGLDVIEGDVQDLDRQPRGAQAIWASPPCQAFSSAGAKGGPKDPRNGIEWTLDAIDHHRPTWVVLENVQGLTFHARSKGCRYPKDGGNAEECPACYLRQFLAALEKRFFSVQSRLINCADLGVPQTRRRLIVVAGPAPIDWPAATHGPSTSQPWVSMESVLGFACTIDGMRNTANHPRQERVRPSTEPAPTLNGKGNQIVQVEGGERRRLTWRECSRLQGFPEGWPFVGIGRSKFRQIGNAVPPRLAEAIALAISDAQDKRSSPR